MGLDIRFPIGLLFTIFGIMLIVFGLLSNPAIYAQSLNVNVNLDWGIGLLVFGLIMLMLGARTMFGSRPASRAPNPPGAAPRH
jgi:hypothetical protein